MNLKVKFLKLTAGRPVAVLNKNLASKISVHADDRINIRKNSHKVIAVVDIAAGMLKENEIVVSTEVVRDLGLKEGDTVRIDLAPRPKGISDIYKKLSCKRLDYKEIREIMEEIVGNALTESEIAYFISAVYKCGMSFQETKSMIRAIIDTGKTLRFSNRIVADKHSIGGIPGRTTPIVVSICAAAGLVFPKTSSRAITSPAGTADAMEVICKVDFTVSEIKKIIKKTNACLVWGGALGLAPADDKIIQVERLLNLDPEPQLLASIMSKKLAVGSKYILIEIPYGKYAKVSHREALKLKSKFERLGREFHVHLECLLFESSQPIGNGIGPALEIKDVIKVLRRESPCFMLESRSLELAAKILEMTGKAKKGRGIELAREMLASGKAFRKFRQIIEAQKGRIAGIGEGKFKKDILADKSGKISSMDIKIINNIAHALGCPADKFAGMYLFKHLGDKVKKGEKIITLYSESRPELLEGINFYKKNNPVAIR